MSAGHTDGPWFVVEATSMKYCSVVEFEYLSGARGSVAMIGKDGATVGAADLDTQNANAHLIAAAPELLGSLRHLRAFWRPGSDHDTNEVQHALAAADAAIAKAEGRS